MLSMSKDKLLIPLNSNASCKISDISDSPSFDSPSFDWIQNQLQRHVWLCITFLWMEGNMAQNIIALMDLPIMKLMGKNLMGNGEK